jgi:hypothetical protein
MQGTEDMYVGYIDNRQSNGSYVYIGVGLMSVKNNNRKLFHNKIGGIFCSLKPCVAVHE